MTSHALRAWRSLLCGVLGLSTTVACFGETDEAPQPNSGTGGAVSATGGVDSAMGGAGAATGGTDPGAINPVLECDDPVEEEIDGERTGFVVCASGWSYRAEARDCPSRVPREEFVSPHAGSCETDLDCTATATSFCGEGYKAGEGPYCPPPITVAACVDGCVRDSDCEEGKICRCGDPVGTCVTASCSSDADCNGFHCASTFVGAGSFLVDEPGYACQAADSDCTGTTGCEDSTRRCYNHHCGKGAVCGRPFLVYGEVRVASGSRASHGWAAEVARPEPSLSTLARARIAEHYAQIALLEHASVAAFARFSLELLALGAPAELVLFAQRAMGDEIEHARLCFGLAQSYGAEVRGPGRLELDGALDASEFSDIVERAMREACIGETIAAIEAEEALASAHDPEIRRVLTRIARDEAQHAELGFRFVRWALSTARPDERARLVAKFRELVRAELGQLARATRSSAPDEGLCDYGILPESRARALRAQVLRDVIEPVLVALSGSNPAACGEPVASSA